MKRKKEVVKAENKKKRRKKGEEDNGDTERIKTKPERRQGRSGGK